MKKNKFLKYLLFALLILLTSFNLSLAGSLDDYDEPAGNFPPPDPNYGNIYRAEMLSGIMASIDSTTSSGELTPATSFFVKRRLNEISNVLISSNEREPLLKASDKNYDISGQLGELETVFNVRKESESARLAALKKNVDKLAATTGNFDSCNSLSDEALKEKLHDLVSNHKSLGYNGIRQAMFSDVDNEGGKVRCVYTARQVSCNSTPNANPPQAMNTEHTWPKSLGAGSEPAKSDINHLYPTDTFANSTRSSYPFGNVTNPKWAQGGSSFDGKAFMPREDHRGKVARAYFYFSIRYNIQIKDAEEKTLRDWHQKYPVVQDEKDRNEKVFGYQGNRNPFVDRPDFVDKIKNF
jgi:endonuclease I